MVSYTEKEMIGITELGRTLNSVVESVASNTIEKIAIFKSNKPKVVMIAFDEYQRIKELADDSIEYHAIADIIDERMPNGKLEHSISHDELIKELRQRGKNV